MVSSTSSSASSRHSALSPFFRDGDAIYGYDEEGDRRNRQRIPVLFRIRCIFNWNRPTETNAFMFNLNRSGIWQKQITDKTRRALIGFLGRLEIGLCLEYILSDVPLCRFCPISESENAEKAPDMSVINGQKVVNFYQQPFQKQAPQNQAQLFWPRSFMELQIIVVEASTLQNLSWNYKTTVLHDDSVMQVYDPHTRNLSVIRGVAEVVYGQKIGKVVSSTFFMAHYPLQFFSDPSTNTKLWREQEDFQSEINNGTHGSVINRELQDKLSQTQPDGVSFSLWNGYIFYVIQQFPTRKLEDVPASSFEFFANLYQKHL